MANKSNYPTFNGTVSDFLKLFSTSLCTNTIKTLSNHYKKKEIGKCMHSEVDLTGECDGFLEAAHRIGFTRQEIVRYILWCLKNLQQLEIKDFTTHNYSIYDSDIIKVNFYEFLTYFTEFHKQNINSIIIPLCHKHHREYDK